MKNRKKFRKQKRNNKCKMYNHRRKLKKVEELKKEVKSEEA